MFSPPEHPIHELADDALQAAAAELAHRLARGVPAVRGAAHRLRERRLRLLRGSADEGHPVLQPQLRHADQ